MSVKPSVCIVSPALADANNGNWHTARRWSRFLSGVADVRIMQAWDGAPTDALIALHARRSAASIARFRAERPHAPIALVMTGTDLYRDIETDRDAQHALECASRIVVLQPQGLNALPVEVRTKARSIVQSASRVRRRDAATGHVGLVAVGHLRAEKDPLTLMAAVRLLPSTSPIRLTQIGRALEPSLGSAAEATMRDCPRYRWIGGLEPAATRRWIARSRALVHASRIEGGANVVIEALRSGVPVLASRIDGNVGLLGGDYAGYFPVGDATALAALMQRFASDAGFARALAAQCEAREAAFTPAAEAGAVRALLRDLLATGSTPR
jgi:putative glycosyltransferase (TIGR04348 family)